MVLVSNAKATHWLVSWSVWLVWSDGWIFGWFSKMVGLLVIWSVGWLVGWFGLFRWIAGWLVC